jgi:hypothetical protein
LSDRRMAPILRPGSAVVIDTSIHTIDDSTWSSEYDRPLYSSSFARGIDAAGFIEASLP